jgi:hypothetical protein
MTPQDIHNLTLETAESVGRLKRINEELEREFPMLRLVNLLSKFNKRAWNSFSRKQKETAVLACDDDDDDLTLDSFQMTERRPE